MDQADGDRLDLLIEKLPDRALDIRLVERPLDFALGIDALVDLDAQMALDQGRRLGPRQIVEPRHPQGADFEHIAKAAGRDQPGARALQLENRVGRDRGAVQQFGDATRLGADLGEQRRQPIDDRAGVIVDARRDLLRVARTVVAEQHDVGEGAADIDPGAETGHPVKTRCSPPSPALLRSGGWARAASAIPIPPPSRSPATAPS